MLRVQYVNTDYWRSNGAEDGRDQSPYQLLIANPNGAYYSFPRADIDSVKVTAVWGGYTTTPEPIVQACFKLVHAEYHLKEAGIAEDRPLATAEGVWLPAGGVSKAVVMMLAPFVRRT